MSKANMGDDRSETKHDDSEAPSAPVSLETGTVGGHQTVPNEKPSVQDIKHVKVDYPDSIVTWDGPEDPQNPQNWPLRKQIYTTALWSITTSWTAFASAVYSAGTAHVAEEFNVSYEVANLGTAVLIFGFAAGPMLWAPLSELYGRKWAALAPYFVAGCFAFGTATAKDIQTIVITRFFAGVFASSPIAICGGAIVDIWPPKLRGTPIILYGITIAASPCLGPIIGAAFVSNRSLGWRWTEYLTGILMMVQCALDILFIDESHADILLTRKAADLRQRTKNWALHSKWEADRPTAAELFSQYLIRPFQMLLDPICLLMTIYGSFVYATFYGLLIGFAIEYGQNRRMGTVQSSLPFLGLFIGCLIAACFNLYNNVYYLKRFVANGYKAVPEARLPPMMYGGFLFSSGMFIFGWTCQKHVASVWPSIVGLLLIGMGFTNIFQASLQYLVDTFTRYSASALAANSFLRSLSAGAFPLFVSYMYYGIGIDFGSTVLGCFAVLLLPAPFFFFKFGRSVRARGQFSRLSTL